MLSMRLRLLSVLVLACVPWGLALAQPSPDATTDSESGVTINTDALNEPAPPPPPADALPQITTLPPVSGEQPAVKGHTALAPPVKRVPLPRQKPEAQTALLNATPSVAPAAEPKVKTPRRAPVITGTAPAQPEMPVTILENSPVEMYGVAADPFASQKVVNPIAGFNVLSRIRFSQGDAVLPDEARVPLDAVAAQLATSKRRIRLAAFSGKAGDMSSQARRLSIERANAVRSYLMSKGVTFEQVVVMPYGGANDGILDRVDVLQPGKS
jgi:outer membrane protein OmpA-like peptidoglycan-associated protein